MSCPCIYWKTTRRRAFFILFLRRLGRFDGGGGDFASVCTLASTLPRLTGVHFSFCFSAGLGVSTMAACILPPLARWPLHFLASPACIFHSVSPPAWAFRRWRRTICLLVYAGLCPSSPHRRAFFFPFLRRLGRFDADGVQFASVCTLASAVPRLTGVHFSSRFSADLGVSNLPAYNLPPCAR